MPFQLPFRSLNRFGAARARVVAAASKDFFAGWHLASLTKGFLKASVRTSGLPELLTHQIAVTCGVATFWRGAWYMMDAIFPDDVLTSGICSIAIGTATFAVGQSLVSPVVVSNVSGRRFAPLGRILALYTLSLSCIAMWRGIWCINDAVSEHVAGLRIDRHLFYSGLASHFCAFLFLLPLGRFSAVVAAPAKNALLGDRGLWFGDMRRLAWVDWSIVHFRR